MEWKKRDALLLYGLGAGLLVITAVVYALYLQPEWKQYQSELRELVAQRFGAARSQAAASDIQQIWIPALDRVDRCTTCHAGWAWKGLEGAPELYRTHPTRSWRSTRSPISAAPSATVGRVTTPPPTPPTPPRESIGNNRCSGKSSAKHISWLTARRWSRLTVTCAIVMTARRRAPIISTTPRHSCSRKVAAPATRSTAVAVSSVRISPTRATRTRSSSIIPAWKASRPCSGGTGAFQRPQGHFPWPPRKCRAPQPESSQLIDIASDKMKLLYDAFTEPEPHYAQIVRVDRLKPIEVYTKEDNKDPNAIWDVKDAVATRSGRNVVVKMTAVRSSFTPTSFEVNQGDHVTVYLTNIEQTTDELHGFGLMDYNINVIVDPGETKTIDFTADKPDVFAYYCTNFCSALHQEMQGYMPAR